VSSVSKGPRLIMTHAGSELGFIPNTLLIFKSLTKTGGYHSKTNFDNFCDGYKSNYFQICLLIL
jgi:hypothetical protein